MPGRAGLARAPPPTPTPRALLQATPTYAGMPLRTQGCEHASKRARMWESTRNHVANPQATLTFASMALRTTWPERV